MQTFIFEGKREEGSQIYRTGTLIFDLFFSEIQWEEPWDNPRSMSTTSGKGIVCVIYQKMNMRVIITRGTSFPGKQTLASYRRVLQGIKRVEDEQDGAP